MSRPGGAHALRVPHLVRSPYRVVRILLLVIAWFNLISALVGLVGLTVGGGFGMPAQWLEGSIFSSFVWPGIILGVVVGGSQALAIAAQYGSFSVAWGLHAAAGLIMMIWIFIELLIILEWSPLQAVYFSTGLVQTVLAVLALDAWPVPFLQRSRYRRHHDATT